VSITVKDTASGSVSNAMSFGIASPATATAGVVQLVTIGTDGTPGNDDSLVAPSISATGRFIAFQSAATNLVSGPASGFQEIYERDTCIGATGACTPSTTRISVTFDGSSVNGHSRDSAISSDGRYVAFDSDATNILPICGSTACIYLRDTCIGAGASCAPSTIAVSLDFSGKPIPGGVPSITPEGRFVVFASAGSGVSAPDTSGVVNVFQRDTCIGAPLGCAPSTSLISQSTGGTSANGKSVPQVITPTGRFVAFQSWASNLVPEYSGQAPADFVRDTCLGASAGCSPSTYQVDLSSSGALPNGPVFNLESPAISPNGRLIAFSSGATNLVSANAGAGDVYVRDTCIGSVTGCTVSTSLVSVANDGSIENCGSDTPTMSASGRFVAFESIATNLVPGDTFPECSFKEVYVRDTCFGAAKGCSQSTVKVSVGNASYPAAQANQFSWYPAMSADGHYIVFLSNATNFLPNSGNGHNMVFLARTGF
jgi:Tol biopolymer transport system component